MVKIISDSIFFNVRDTLECGQIFRYEKSGNGYLIYTGNRCCFAENADGKAVISCAEADREFFFRFFDLGTDYAQIYEKAAAENEEILRISAAMGKGIRILNQDAEETLFSFIISQNNNISNIQRSIGKLCDALGGDAEFDGNPFKTFPSAEKIAAAPIELIKSFGVGYRAQYLLYAAKKIASGNFVISELFGLSGREICEELIKLRGVGEKVAACVALFGFHKTDVFPVDVWIDRVYRQDFKGTLSDRKKIEIFFIERFAENSGYFQQYLFYYKRSQQTYDKR